MSRSSQKDWNQDLFDRLSNIERRLHDLEEFLDDSQHVADEESPDEI